MDQLDRRHAFEDKAKEIGGKVLGSGWVRPFTMDFNFVLDGREYSVVLEKKKLTSVEEATIDEKEAGNVTETA
jgi:hypothetical protein